MADRGAIERTVVAAMAVATVLLVVLLSWESATDLRGPGIALVLASLYAVIPALAGSLAYARSRDQGVNRGPWLLLTSSLLIIAVSHGLRVFGFYSGLPGPWETIGVLGIVIGYPLAFTGMARLAGHRGDLGGNRMWLDALIIGLGVYSVGIAMMSAALSSQPSLVDPGSMAVQSVFVGLDLFILALCSIVASRYSWRLPASWWLVMAAFMVFTVGDAALLAITAFEGTTYPTLYESPIAFLLIGLAAYADRGMPAPSGPRRDPRYTIPALAVGASLLVLLWRPGGPLALPAILAASVAVGVSFGRLMLAARDYRRLAEGFRLARTDDLTGLPNRRALLDQAVQERDRRAVVVLNIDDFKEVNTTFGLAAGDRLLVMVAERFADHVRHPDLLTRLGADEFAVVLAGADSDGAVRAAERLLTLLEAPFQVDGVTIHLTASVGVAVSAGRACEMGTLLREADFAMHQAKADGPGIVRLESGEVGQLSKERLVRRSQLRSGLEAGGEDFLAYYQPVVRLDTGEAVSVEALVRWRPEAVVLGPQEFLPDVDAGGLLVPLTRLMIRRALSEVAGRDLGIRVAVNIPPDLVGPWLESEVTTALAETQAPPDRLTLEITEDALMRDPAAATGVLSRIRATGVRVLLDDFGTGWSGLSTLRDLSVDGIKIDRSFVVKAAEDPSAWAIVESVTSLARALGLTVTAEGAEDGPAVQVLRDLGVDYLQGFIVARPMPVDALVPWLASRPADIRP